jgi:phosphoribosylamine--glycine ligase
MNVLVVGSGGREHALAWKIRQSPRVTDLYIAPGNAGTATVGQNLDIPPLRIDDLAKAAEDYRIDLTVVGPEAPLAAGIVDLFESRGLPVFGPSQAATQIESSKVFSKRLMQKYRIPSAEGKVFASYQEARDYLQSQPLPVVIKADGLAAGKGVVVAGSQKQAIEALSDFMEKRTLGAAGERVIIEECLEGREVSLLAFTDGNSVRPLVPACDYKRVFDGDRGPNTGGMGSYSPPGFFGQASIDLAYDAVLLPAVRAMKHEGIPYKGVLYAGLMISGDGIKVLEFNARFGDPETQVLLPRLKSDLVEVMLALVRGDLERSNIEWSSEACVGVVLASGGYPAGYSAGFPITGLDRLPKDILVFHSGTASRNGVVTSGGRVMTVAALAGTLAEARTKAYDSIPVIRFEGCHYRRDIAAREAT